jgi:hypothetical protein
LASIQYGDEYSNFAKGDFLEKLIAYYLLEKGYSPRG